MLYNNYFIRLLVICVKWIGTATTQPMIDMIQILKPYFTGYLTFVLAQVWVWHGAPCLSNQFIVLKVEKMKIFMVIMNNFYNKYQILLDQIEKEEMLVELVVGWGVGDIWAHFGYSGDRSEAL